MTHTPGPWEAVKICIGNHIVIGAENQALHPQKGYYSSEDAALIAAAPDLLVALELVHANAAETPEWIRTRIAPAMAKARGEPTP